ncbi:polyprenyl synthetase family protein [Staphylococcus intermedius]|uniref:Heptaprenyl diphosphate synthase component II n=2 Tax=Staphylococcus TaxID=1279 RepID=A0A380G8H2_STAIN|nr:polyprenyl synthetase family protein [Staphylococcus intermedius]PCF64886.1 heptaprenyl diphosphate synthase [Staphylococcus intermedius]PCF80496.1 heptaprenyl diphosphate synthase [Staphylococcus intermedius]PCF81846.1 heptaprenyl diphosphate synthase [Staphylococcus intermedius]PCF88183.1 heptaprenyl diphosphate synthase [Staphylococcus intermedius]PCF88897.1 heptaprenyl diphosphate synthase [Staphylococcus intermedius]
MSKLNLNQEIKKIENTLKQLIQSEDSTLQSAADHLLSSGGKRVRPLFVILSSHVGENPANDATYRVATALELIHMATLVHDDVIDYSDKRRGRLTIEKKWDQPTAILTGNFLLARALEHLSYIQDSRIHQTLSSAIIEVCRGELFQFQDQFRAEQSITNYLRRINRKTALLMQLATEVGAMSSQADTETIRKMRDIGHHIGMSFQIVDDVLDFTSTEKKLGKPVGSDLRNGHMTLPVLLAMKHHVELKEKVATLTPNSPTEDFDWCIEQIRQSKSISQSLEVSQKYLDKASALLETLPKNEIKPHFRKLIKRLQNRMN